MERNCFFIQRVKMAYASPPIANHLQVLFIILYMAYVTPGQKKNIKMGKQLSYNHQI